jgi:hypothetical protein
VRGLLGLVWSDLEGKVLELEGYTVVREYLVLLAVRRAVALLREKMPPREALEALDGLLREAAMGAEVDLLRFGVYISDAAAAIRLEAEGTVERREKEKTGQATSTA